MKDVLKVFSRVFTFSYFFREGNGVSITTEKGFSFEDNILNMRGKGTQYVIPIQNLTRT